ncbi:MAG: diguanylate cyclase [Bacteroidetes bacterium]|nr:diguanylate cyclase [Bacteroidota bacterium]
MSPSYRLLIVDDNPDTRYSLKKTLQQPGYEFREAHDGESAIRAVQENSIDIILLDVRLPGKLDGFQICESIRQFEKHIPIVFVTANLKEFVDQVTGYEKGGDDYVIQPFDPREMVIKIKSLLRNKRLYDDLLKEVKQLDEMKGHLSASNEELTKLNNQLAEKNDHLVSLTITDPLTSLYNRKYFHQRIEKEISAVRRYKNPASVAVLDIDDYNRINEEFSMKQGDVVLKELASLLVSCVRTSDVVIRYDAGKFAIIFTHTPPENAMIKARMIHEAVAAYPFPVYEDLVPEDKFSSMKEKAVKLSSTIVVCGLNHHWVDTEATLIKHLEQSLKNAKADGGNRILTVQPTA